MLSINTNNASMAAVNAISKSSSSLSTSMERLATGNRINSSADDAAGKQIANRLTAQSSGMGVALSNINDATAMLQTADSMFDEMSDAGSYERPVNSGSERHLQRRRPAGDAGRIRRTGPADV